MIFKTNLETNFQFQINQLFINFKIREDGDYRLLNFKSICPAILYVVDRIVSEGPTTQKHSDLDHSKHAEHQNSVHNIDPKGIYSLMFGCMTIGQAANSRNQAQ